MVSIPPKKKATRKPALTLAATALIIIRHMIGEFSQIIITTALAGLAIPLGGLIACLEHIRPNWLEEEFRHTLTAFGGGVLFSAVSLVLVPEGIRGLSWPWVAIAMLVGGFVFLLLDEALSRHGTPAAQLVAMLSDFIPEALALGAAFASQHPLGLLLALLIGLQNLPEGFNAFRELTSSARLSRCKILWGFLLLAVLGPLAGISGRLFLADHPSALHLMMLFAAGGILYLIFQDIAPQAKLERRWAPALGAVAGFLLGLIGQMLIVG